MKITHVVAEIYPLASVGGYSRVVHALTSKQSESNIVNIITPYYSGFSPEIKNKISKTKQISFINQQGKKEVVKYSTLFLKKNLTVYLIINKDYYQYRTNVYGYTDDANRWAYLSYVTLELISRNIVQTDVIHTHDWHTGILQNIKNVYFKKINLPVVFTIHNLKFQAMFDHHNSDLQHYDKWQSLPWYSSVELQKLNFLKRAIKYADRCVFVSNGYLKEVLNGVNDELLLPLLTKNKQKLSFVLNGIDNMFNPLNASIFLKYDRASIESKAQNKVYLQEKLGLIVSKESPLLCFIGRLCEQKGIKLLIDTLDVILRNSDAEFVQLGGGDNNYLPELNKLRQKYENRVYIYGKSDFHITPQVFASSDICLVPSKFEPCGIVPMEAQVFGCIPVVNDTGGLNDSTINYLDNPKNATGFIFQNFDKDNFIFTLSKALELFNNKNEWKKLIKNAMAVDFSWEKSAGEYMEIYKNSIKYKV